MTESGLAAWLQRLEALHPKSIDLGLERVREVAQRLNLLRGDTASVVIAGTNGKGTTAAALEALLLAAGRRPGVSTSPHFLRFNERIRVSGEEAEDEQIVAAFEAIEAARADISLTYFEFGVLAALWIFREAAVDVLVLEVGLGGRLDAVNIVDADVAVITAIGLDHQAWLGETRDEIGREKAGILRHEANAVIADPDPPAGLVEAVSNSGARALYLGRDFFCEEGPHSWRARLRDAAGNELALPDVAQSGLVPANLCGALQAAQLLGIEVAALALPGLLAELQVKGRRQRREIAGLHYVLDVAHNLQSLEKLREFLSLTPREGRTIALFSAMEDKPINAMIQALRGQFDAWFLADQADNPRAASAADIAGLLRGEGEHMISVSKNLTQALRRAQSIMEEGDTLVVFGSFYTVAGVMPALEKDRARSEG